MVTNEITEIKKLKKLQAICLIIILFVLTDYFVTNQGQKQPENANKFYKQGFSTIVVSSKIVLSKSTEFHLKNGLNVYLMLPVDDKIIIGDSVQKQSNTYSYNVYRKNSNNTYDLFGIYYFGDSYLDRKIK